MKPPTKRPATWATQKMVGERIKIVDKASRKASRKICCTNDYNRSQRIQRKSPCSITIVLSALNDFRIVVMITCRFFKNLMVRNTRNALSALIALNMRSSLKMAATSKEPTFCTISGSRKSTTVKRTMSRSIMFHPVLKKYERRAYSFTMISMK